MAVRHGWYSSHLPIKGSDQIGKCTAPTGFRSQLMMTAGPEDWKPHYLPDDSIGNYLIAVAMKKNLCYKKRLNKIIAGVNNSGLYKQMAIEENFKA
ncbi:hypothetical protein HNY73_001152 [Argiope bruennichi]|uniref:Uncharacterized protein n=1 Tax=Argiope bruennichi TaxID=94029 RepID=A0A8T0G2U3_ARGBR|nr:hypothetical protein HNY73_001152 [Argiope bruennichi]